MGGVSYKRRQALGSYSYYLSRAKVDAPSPVPISGICVGFVSVAFTSDNRGTAKKRSAHMKKKKKKKS